MALEGSQQLVEAVAAEVLGDILRKKVRPQDSRGHACHMASYLAVGAALCLCAVCGVSPAPPAPSVGQWCG